MAFVGRLHPLLIHFPIALVIAAALAEVVAMVTADERWLGTAASGGACSCARNRRRSRPVGAGVRMYPIALFAVGTLVDVTGHFGGLLVWGANFLHP